MNKKFISTLLAAAVFMTVASFAYRTLSGFVKEPTLDDGSASASQAEPVKALDFTVYDTQGNPVKLSSFEGKPVVLNFWASWCPPCIEEMPSFETVSSQYADEVTFLMVNATDGGRETLSIAQDFIAANAYTFPVFYDLKEEAVNAYRVSSLPTTYFIDSEGILKEGRRGGLSEAKLLERIKKLLEQE